MNLHLSIFCISAPLLALYNYWSFASVSLFVRLPNKCYPQWLEVGYIKNEVQWTRCYVRWKANLFCNVADKAWIWLDGIMRTVFHRRPSLGQNCITTTTDHWYKSPRCRKDCRWWIMVNMLSFLQSDITWFFLLSARARRMLSEPQRYAHNAEWVAEFASDLRFQASSQLMVWCEGVTRESVDYTGVDPKHELVAILLSYYACPGVGKGSNTVNGDTWGARGAGTLWVAVLW